MNLTYNLIFMNPESPSPELLPPQSMAEKAVEIGIRKARGSTLDLFVLGMLAGAYIAFGAIFATVVTAGAKDMLAYGVIRLLAGLAFTLGLILVVVGGAELFTGNNLMLMAWAKTADLLALTPAQLGDRLHRAIWWVRWRSPRSCLLQLRIYFRHRRGGG